VLSYVLVSCLAVSDFVTAFVTVVQIEVDFEAEDLEYGELQEPEQPLDEPELEEPYEESEPEDPYDVSELEEPYEEPEPEDPYDVSELEEPYEEPEDLQEEPEQPELDESYEEPEEEELEPYDDDPETPVPISASVWCAAEEVRRTAMVRSVQRMLAVDISFLVLYGEV